MRHLVDSAGCMALVVRKLRLGTTGHNDGDQGEERAHGDWPCQQNVAWLWQRYQTPANLHCLPDLPCIVSQVLLALFGIYHDDLPNLRSC
jgi:hypothetical protein